MTTELIKRIRQYFPDLAINQMEVNSDGLMNDVLVVNQERVFRFARDEEWIRESLAREIRVLELVKEYVRIPVPVFDVQEADCVSYRLLPGQGLSRADILRQAEKVQDALAQQLAVFLSQLRSIPVMVLEQHAIPPTNATQTREEYVRLLEDLEREVLFLANTQVRRIIRKHFEPLLQDRLDLNFEPALTHGDLGQRHILFDPRQGCITGVLDFGVAGVGDPAQDLAVILNCYGESFVRRMARFTPEIKEMIDRARFMSGIAEPRWVLQGLRTKNPFWFTPGLGTARDIMPIGSEWP